EELGAELDKLPTRQEGFTIDSDGAADWAVRKIGEAEARMRRDAATVRAEAERWEAWQAKRDEQNQATIDYMQSRLSAYYDQIKAEGLLPRKSRSYKLPHGVLQARTHAIKWHRDEARLLEWARGVGLVRTREEPEWNEIVKRLAPEAQQIGAAAIDTATGEVVEGVTVEELPKDVFNAKADLT
ncbi:MAG: host-nuclease inhibitor Gam family protein, partial [Candidatus Omnitrophota bacterium]|nr:host-nuclease inhibitor Gam family protein [Candidatus Omnitrophota bacterium]